MGHHTKDKGDLGVAKAHADLVAQGFVVLFPATEHAPFDLVAYRHGVFHRIQVKFRDGSAGTVEVQFRSIWSDRAGVHYRVIDKTAVDFVCIYCPQTDECYYVKPREHRAGVTLRVVPSRNNQKLGVRMASAYRRLQDEGGPVVPDA